MGINNNALFRQIEILRAIPNTPDRAMSTATIQTVLEGKGFNVPARTLQRDLKVLTKQFNLNCDTSMPMYKWSFKGNSPINFESMDTATALTWVLARDQFSGLLPKIVMEQLNQYFEAAQNYLDGLRQNSLVDWTKRVASLPNGKPLIPAKVDDRIWWNLSLALLEGYALDVVYNKRGEGEPKSYVIHPYGMIIRHSVSYLVGSANDHQDIAHFALHRFLQAKKSDQPYRSVPSFKIQDHISKGGFGVRMSEGLSYDVQLYATIKKELAQTLLETPLGFDQELRLSDSSDSYELIVTIPNDQQTFMWVLSHGSQINVIEPVEWREKIHEHAKAILSASI
ncbi:WYL domain-containing protein [Marinomonas sp. A79]|uniref:WYL domain-containing protein n=1 Tax=Marinomonas vulgaris TaxID=2823372 RepID=A0ABS5HE30_9GAMM|nr:WYL domain-containing protein [Marinomonas vulgaris]MBR7889911.1 WYL domain-containing protein [Marinomonas vulgaris]